MSRNRFTTFADRDGVLHCEQVDLRQVAEQFGTPAYVYSASAIRGALVDYRSGLSGVPHLVCYAVKANPCRAILRIVAGEGGGADLTSVGEMRQALRAGIQAERMVFSGVGKRPDEIQAGVEAGVLMLNAESGEELRLIDRIARNIGKRAGIALRINPNIDPKTHPKISTGLRRNKFGIETESAVQLYHQARKMRGVEIRGIACHIGSSIIDSAPLLEACDLLVDLRRQLAEDGIWLPYLDLGGGLGIRYHDECPDTPGQYAQRLSDRLKSFDGTLILEPGRSVVGNAGVLLSTVLYRKDNGERVFDILDAAMNDLVRPAMYGAYHEILPVVDQARETEVADVVGPICETGDTFAYEREIPHLERGDLVAVMSAGAYCMAMASQYNGRPRPAEILVEGDTFRLVRRRERIEDLWREDIEE
jgi:diaminopimelate decarboxylase